MMEREAQVFAALGDTTRRQLLTTLAQHSPRTATQLAGEFPITRQGISKHLDLLEQAGLVEVRTVGRERQYSFTPEPLEEVTAWVSAVGARWDERLQRLKHFVEDDEANP